MGRCVSTAPTSYRLNYTDGHVSRSGDDGAHSTNEKLDLSNYLEGTKALGQYLLNVPAAAASA